MYIVYSLSRQLNEQAKQDAPPELWTHRVRNLIVVYL